MWGFSFFGYVGDVYVLGRFVDNIVMLYYNFVFVVGIVGGWCSGGGNGSSNELVFLGWRVEWGFKEGKGDLGVRCWCFFFFWFGLGEDKCSWRVKLVV